jgi:protein phosphatase
MSTLNIGCATDIGRVRKTNQDSTCKMAGGDLGPAADGLFIVADGMGGRAGGEIASRVTVETIPQIVRQELGAQSGAKTPEMLVSALREGISAANDAVWNQARSNPELRGMGTTCVALLVYGNKAALGNVGDSRAYLLRGGQFAQITSDHSLVQEHVLAGDISASEARSSRYRNVITRAIGLTDGVAPDVDTLDLRDGDTILLCSDGLTNMLADRAIGQILSREADAQKASDLLVAAANANGGTDNITAVVVRHGSFTSIPLIEENGHSNVDLFAHQPVRIAPALRAVLYTMFILIAAGALGAWYVYNRYAGWPELRHRRSEEAVVALPSVSVDMEYGTPVALSNRPFRGEPLLADPAGGVIAMTDSGKLVRVSRSGMLSAPFLPPTGIDATSERHWAVDSNGNRYISLKAAGAIHKYDAKGVRIAVIANGTLHSPEGIAVDPAGDIYVIDDHRLMLIRARKISRPSDLTAQDRTNGTH